jgi:CO/xanthine dehydrogenase Mo-binding subunit
VKLVLDIEEAIYTTRADAAHITVRSGFDASGYMLARDFDITLDTGAYADNSPLVLDKAINRCFGPYQLDNLRVRGRAVYTTTSPASSYRGFGAFQGNLAGETNVDQAAERLGIDPVELRRQNLVGKGDVFIPSRRPMDAQLADDLDLLVGHVGPLGSRQDPDGRIIATGIGLSASDAGAIPTSTAQVRVLPDGSVLLLTGSTEMGQGSRTVLSQIVAAELGVPLEQVRIAQSDTQATSFERTTGASRTTTIAGLAVLRACDDARAKLCAMAADVAGVPPAGIEVEGGAVHAPDGATFDFADLITRWFGSGGGEVTGLGVVRREGNLELLPPFWEIGMVGVGLGIDPATGVVEVEQLVTVADVGLAINPGGVEGQDLGAATQGLGGALFEELHYDGPQILNANMVEYRVPRITDRPKRYDSEIAQRRDGVGPYGAKGAGEGALNPIGSAVASAVARATGRWPDRLPLTPERVWRLFQAVTDDPTTSDEAGETNSAGGPA